MSSLLTKRVKLFPTEIHIQNGGKPGRRPGARVRHGEPAQAQQIQSCLATHNMSTLVQGDVSNSEPMHSKRTVGDDNYDHESTRNIQDYNLSTFIELL